MHEAQHHHVGLRQREQQESEYDGQSEEDASPASRACSSRTEGDEAKKRDETQLQSRHGGVKVERFLERADQDQ